MEQTQQIGTASINKARLHRTQRMTATIRLRIVCRSGTACNQWNGIKRTKLHVSASRSHLQALT
jgi:hypothetical protein